MIKIDDNDDVDDYYDVCILMNDDGGWSWGFDLIFRENIIYLKDD